MNKRIAVAAGLFALLSVPLCSAEAQGLIGGAQEGAARGNAAAGPIGGIVGGAVGAGVGTVNGALGIPGPRYRRGYYNGRRYYYRNGRRYYY